jgi:glyoxylase-like metal-dependent hydrolase (beta-lactamase superfamily II)
MPHFVFVIAVSLAIVVPGSARALDLVTVVPDVHALVGELGQRSPSNLGNNSTHGFVVTSAGVVVIDPGATAKGAAQIEQRIRAVSDRPIVAVINTGGQDHRWLGNGYFKARGARLIASQAAIADQKQRFDLQWMTLRMLVGEAGLEGTEPVYAETAIAERTTLGIGETTFELIPSGGAHTPGDLIVWLPGSRIAFAGDVVYTDRLLAVLPVSSTRNWLAAFALLESLNPGIVIPGHGKPGSLATARRHTGDYLAHIRGVARRALDRGDTIEAALKSDQSMFSALTGFDLLARPNLQQTYIEMEFE